MLRARMEPGACELLECRLFPVAANCLQDASPVRHRAEPIIHWDIAADNVPANDRSEIRSSNETRYFANGDWGIATVKPRITNYFLCPTRLIGEWWRPFEQAGYKIYLWADWSDTQPIIDSFYGPGFIGRKRFDGDRGGIIAGRESFIWVEIRTSAIPRIIIPDGYHFSLVGTVPFKSWRCQWTTREKTMIQTVLDGFVQMGMIPTTRRAIRRYRN